MSRSMIIVMWTSDLIVKEIEFDWMNFIMTWLWHHWTDGWDGWERGKCHRGSYFSYLGETGGPVLHLRPCRVFVSARRNFRAFKSARRNWATLPQLVFKTLVARSIGIHCAGSCLGKKGKILPWTRPSHCRIPGRVGIFLVVLCQNDPTKPNAPCSCSKFLGFLGRKLLATERERPAHIAAADAQPVNQIASKLVNS
jgi:hypothetical protein